MIFYLFFMGTLKKSMAGADLNGSNVQTSAFLSCLLTKADIELDCMKYALILLNERYYSLVDSDEIDMYRANVQDILEYLNTLEKLIHNFPIIKQGKWNDSLMNHCQEFCEWNIPTIKIFPVITRI